jgi:hypothetical protein
MKGTLLGKKYLLGCISPAIGVSFLKLLTVQSAHKPFKQSEFSCDRSITKATLLLQQCTFSAISSLPIEECVWNFTHVIHGACLPKGMFGCDVPIIKSIFLGQQCIFSAAYRVPFEGFFWNTTPFFNVQTLQWDFFMWPLNNEGNVTSGKMYLLGCTSPAIGGVFLEFLTCHFRCITYNGDNSGCDRSVMTGTLLGE